MSTEDPAGTETRPVVTTAQARLADRRTIELGTPGLELMERAGRGIFAEIAGPLRACALRGVTVLAGRGNNGGDGFVVARLLADAGFAVEVCLLGSPDRVGGDARTNLLRWLASGGRVSDLGAVDDPQALASELRRAGVVVDAIFGTGLNSRVEGPAARLVEAIEAARRPSGAAAGRGSSPVVLAVDLPSGLDGDTGEPWGRAVPADVTVVLGGTKLGLLLPAARPFVGRLVEVDIGLAPEAVAGIEPLARAATARMAAALLPARRVSGHKGTHGHVVVAAGSPGKAGAAALAGRGAIRGGAGLVTIATPGAVRDLVAGLLPEAMTESWPEETDGWRHLLTGRDAVVCGPGLGRGTAEIAVARSLSLEAPIPLVLDADGLNAFEGRVDELRSAPGPRVLTPHPGEASRLAGGSVAEIQADRLGFARSLAARTASVVALKGAGTVVAAPDGRTCVNTTGSSILGTGGTGDVLAGLLAALLAQGLDAFSAARLGVYLHGLAGERIAARRGDAGLLASELADEIPSTRATLGGAGGRERCGSTGALL